MRRDLSRLIASGNRAGADTSTEALERLCGWLDEARTTAALVELWEEHQIEIVWKDDDFHFQSREHNVAAAGKRRARGRP
jgi:hypothetical protein